jgi:thiamine kinase
MARTMAAADQLAGVLSAWREWDTYPPLEAPPTLGELWAEGSGHRLYALEDCPSLCLRLRHRPTSTVTGGFPREVSAWRHAAKQGLAPRIAYVIDAEEAVVCERLYPDGKSISGNALGALARAIHQLPETPYSLCLHEVINDYLIQIPAAKQRKWRSVVDNPRTNRALQLLEEDTPRLCHNDLTTGNLLYRQGQWVAIDWEYAAMGSRYFDVAIAMEGLPREDQEALVNVTFEGAPNEELLASGRLIGQLCTQLWQECFEADAKDDSTRRPQEGHAV